MERVAVFVDAGYLFSAGSEAISGSKRKRSEVRLDERAVASALRVFATDASGLPLLRIYWYDGTSGVMSTQQIALARCNDLKVRLGAVNSSGQQKGVDSLIITDMISLARNRAMADAVLISGDEDVRVGMQQAQEWGVRVHLLGIDGGRSNQSPALIQEADTCSIWTATEVQGFMSVTQPSSGATGAAGAVVSATTPVVPTVVLTGPGAAVLATVLTDVLDGLDESTLRTCGSPGTRSIPADVDGKLLWQARKSLGRTLSDEERRDLRKAFMKEARNRAQTMPAPAGS